MSAITCRTLAIVVLAISAWSSVVVAKDEHRKVTWTWRLYGGSSGDFSSAQAVIDTYNAGQEQQYAACSAQAGACKTCTKFIHTPPTNPAAGVSAKINGQWNWLMTNGHTITSYYTGCAVTGNPPSGPTSTPSSGAIAASANLQCPTGWGGTTYNLHYEPLGAGQVTVYDLDCVRFVPDCPECNRPGPPVLYGNPIDAVGNAKIESVTDYASADGLLHIARDYSSQSGRWSWNHEILITDFSGRSSVRHDAVALKAYVKLIPEGIYSGSAPAAVDQARSFQLTTSPAAGTSPQVWINGARGTRTVFTESAGVFATAAPNKPQLSLIPGPGGTQRWLLRDRNGRFDVFDIDGHLLEQVNADGRSLTYARGAGTLTVTATPGGSQLVYSRTSPTLVDGAYDTVTLPDGHQLQYAINGAALVTAVTYADATSRSYLYDEAAYSGVTSGTAAANRLTGLIDEDQVRSATYKYDSYGPISTELAGGVNKFTLNTNFGGGSGSRQIQRPPNNATETVNWDVGPDGERRVYSRSLPAGAGSSPSAKSVSYDPNGLVTSITDDRGNRTCYANDGTRGVETVRLEGVASGVACPANLATHTIPANTRQRKITTQWHPDWNLPIARAEPKRITTWVYNGQPDPFAGGTASCAPGTALLPDGSAIAVLCKKVEQATTDETGTAAFSATSSGTPRTWTYTYNAFGQVLTADGPRTDVTDVTTYTYYSCSTGYQCGHLASVTNAAGHTTTYDSYNAHGQPLAITDPNGLVTTLTYDLRQRLTSRTVGTEQTTFDYWPTGLLKKTTLPDGSFLEYSYDAAHRLTGVNDDEGNRIGYTLDTAGNRTKEEAFDPLDVLATTRSHAFDALSRTSQEIGAAGTAAVTTNLLYDNNGNTRGVNAPLSRNTVSTYDELDRLSQVTDPASGLTKYAYDGLDQPLSVTDPRNKVTSYAYSGLGDLTQQVSPDTGTTTNTYDSGGNLQTSTDARSKTGTYTYDALNRVTSVTYPDQTIGYTYDSGTNQKGRLTQVTDTSGSTSWTYDTHGRVLSRQQSMGVTKTLGYAYNSAGRLQTLTLPSGNTISYGYTDGKIASLTLNGSTTILSNVLYQPFGPTQGWTWGNSTLAVREYDTDGKVTDIDSAGLKIYSYDGAFRITGITDAANSSLSQSYGYDLLDRLTSATGTSLNQGWIYDANGSRLTQTGSAASTYTVSGTSSRLSSISGALSRTYSYDNAGNATADGSATFTYNDAGRMVSAAKAGVNTTYALNALGQRVKKTTSGSSRYFAYDEVGHLVGEYDNSGNLIQETVWLGDIPVATLRPNGAGVNLFYVHTDHLNTPRRISRPSDNAIVWRWDSDPFGTTAANQDPDADSNLFGYNLRFPGQYFDIETGLHYNYFRDYDPATGRYPQSDPIGLAGGLNTYGYVNANPVSLSDPLGLDACRTALRAAGGLVGGASGMACGCLVGGAAGGAGGTLVAPGVGTVGGAAAGCGAAGSWGGAAGAALGGLAGDKLADAVCDDGPDCKKASPWQLLQAGIFDAHEFKTDYGAVPNSRFDICACKDGSIVIKEVGGCGKPGPGITTGIRWK